MDAKEYLIFLLLIGICLIVASRLPQFQGKIPQVLLGLGVICSVAALVLALFFLP